MYQQNIRSTRSCLTCCFEPSICCVRSNQTTLGKPEQLLLLPDLMPPNLSRAEQSRGVAGSPLLRAHGDKPPKKNPDSRVADVDPRADLVEVFGGPAVEAAVVRQQVVELLQRHLEARHVRPVRHLLAPLVLHPVSGGLGEVADGCHFTRPGRWASPPLSGRGC